MDRSAGSTFAARLDPRDNSLNLIRLLLATTVIVSHSWSVGGYGLEPLHGGFAPGGWAVDAFFVLSGYLITGSRFSNSLPRYLWYRVLRIYPGYVVCLLTAVLVFAPFGYYHQHGSLDGYVTHHPTPLRFLFTDLGLKMHTVWIAGTPTGNGRPWTGSLWTLWFEFLCYLIVGLVACWAAYRRNAVLCALLFIATSVASIEQAPITAALHSSQAFQLCRLVPLFLAGSLIYLLRERLPCTWPLALASTAFLVLWPHYTGYQWVVLCALPLTYVLLYLGAVVPFAVGRRNDISYGMYMYGFPVEQAMRYAQFQSQTVYALCSIAATVPLAAASWWCVENPVMRWGRRLARRSGEDRVGDRGAVRAPGALEAADPLCPLVITVQDMLPGEADAAVRLDGLLAREDRTLTG
jgi:peptidoglycan/LPS O-acetylase OafA/YrhL